MKIKHTNRLCVFYKYINKIKNKIINYTPKNSNKFIRAIDN